MKTSITNLLLLPRSYSINNHMLQVEKLLEKHPVFTKLYQLEEEIQPVLVSMEEQGLVIDKNWLTTGLEEKGNQLTDVAKEISGIIEKTDVAIVKEERLMKFWKENDLPAAKNFDRLKRYRKLHPTFQMMLTYKNHQNYLKMWGERVKEKGSIINDGILIKGSWQSFASYTGRITAKDLPLTSMPISMRDYVQSPSGYQIYSLDFSNIELRFLAYYAKCGLLLKQFSQGIDVHAETVKLIRQCLNNHDLKEGQARKLAKQFSYSLLYGAGVKTITKNIQKAFPKVTNADVMSLIERFYEKYPELLRFLLERGEDEKLLTPYGKIKPVKSFTQTQKKNFTLQSSVSVAIKILLIALEKNKIKVVHVIHDEVWILIPEGEDVEHFTGKAMNEFNKEVNELFLELPTESIISKEKIGGK